MIQVVMWGRIRRYCVLSGLVIALHSGHVTPVSAATDCGPERVWTECAISDGFNDQFMVYSRGTTDNGPNSVLFVWCSNSKLNVFANFNSVDFSPAVSAGELGFLQVRIDGGVIKTYQSQTVPSTDGKVVSTYVYRQPNQVASSMLRGKKILFKIPTSGGFVVATYKLAGFAKYAAKFKSSGCPLK